MKKLIALLGLALLAASAASATTYYVDSAVGSSGSGTSWGSAWKGFSNMTGLTSGDTVYFSGGTTSKTYSVPTNWIFDKAGVTYKIGQDAGHKGTAIFQGSGTFIILRAANVTISGNAGDGSRHFKTSGFGQVFEATHASADDWQIEYLDGGTSLTKFGYYDSNTGGELNNCYGRGSSTCDGLFYWQPTGSGYTSNLCHDNQFEVMNQHNGIGSDVFQGNNSYTSFYNNKIYGIGGSYSGGQHQDGHQPLSGNYIAIYNCEFRDIGNYPIFFDAYYGDFSNAKIYNNFIWVTDTGVYNGSPQGIAIGPDGGAFNQMGRWPVFTNVNVWNNTVFDMRNVNPGIAMRAPGSTQATWNSCTARNNVLVNCSGYAIDSATQSNNVSYTSAQAPSHFVSYSPVSASNDPHIKSGESGLTNAGTDLSAFFTTDKDGNLRVLPYDIGAFESGSSGGPPPVPTTPVGTPISSTQIDWTWGGLPSDNTGVVFEWANSSTGPWTVINKPAGATSHSLINLSGPVTYYARVKATSVSQPGYSGVGSATTLAPSSTIAVTPTGAIDFGMRRVGTSQDVVRTVTANGGSVSGSVTSSSPKWTVINGTYTLSAGQSQQVTFRFNPDAAGDYSTTFTWTGGGGATTAGTGRAYGTVFTQTAAEDLVWDAWDAAGYFTTGSTLTRDAAGQRIYGTAQTTTLSTAPFVLWDVVIAQPGVYVMRCLFSAENDGRNSWFVAVNGVPADQNLALWDTPVTGLNVYQTANVTARGNGDSTAAGAQYQPMEIVFNSTGHIQVLVATREINCYLRQITMEYQAPGGTPPNAPTNAAAVAESDTQITVTWTAPASATSQHVERSLTSGSGFSDVSGALTGTATTWTDTGRTEQTTYYYRVVATNADGDSPASAEASATTAATPTPEIPSPTGGRLLPVNPANTTNLFL